MSYWNLNPNIFSTFSILSLSDSIYIFHNFCIGVFFTLYIPQNFQFGLFSFYNGILTLFASPWMLCITLISVLTTLPTVIVFLLFFAIYTVTKHILMYGY